MSLDIARSMSERFGPVYAQRWLTQQREKQAQSDLERGAYWTPESRQELLYKHESYTEAAKRLEPYREALGAAYETLHLICRWSCEHASDANPAPHLMTTYWVLEEATGKSERTLRRHLIGKGHPWSAVVSSLIDVRHNLGKLLDGKDERGRDKTRTCITSMVIRFFPRGRQSDAARVKRWGERDLLQESDEGRTRPTRQRGEKVRYARLPAQMSAYRSVKEQSQENNWVMLELAGAVSSQKQKNFGNLYADIPNAYVLDALRSDLDLALETTRERGASVQRARSKWVNAAAKVLAERHRDHTCLPHHLNDAHVTHFDGFTNLWRLLLWTALKTELYGGTTWGWTLISRMITLAAEGRERDVDKPSAWAWVQVREEVLALKRDYGSGTAGALLA